MLGGVGFLIFLLPFIVWGFFLLSLNKLVDAVRVEDDEMTDVNKLLVWLQVIPFVGFIVLIVFNLKMETAARAYERKYNLGLKSIEYPAVLCWLVILGALYVLIPFIGVILLLIFMVAYWVRVSSTTKQLMIIKSQN